MTTDKKKLRELAGAATNKSPTALLQSALSRCAAASEWAYRADLPNISLELNRAAIEIKHALVLLNKKPSNPDDAEVCSHIWEHLHGMDKNNEYRCRKCGSRKP